MSALLYILTAMLALALARCVVPLSWRAAVVLTLIPLCFAGRAMLTGRIYAPIDLAYASEPLASVARAVGVDHTANPALSDVFAQFIPWNVALRKAIARGEWPLWNPYEFCGDPLAGTAQSAPYHPVTLIGLLAPLADALTFIAAITLFLAALTMFLFLRDLRCDELPSLFGAGAWALSTHLFSFLLTALGLTICIAPLVFLGARRVVVDPLRKSAALLVIALTLLTLAGHPETEMHVVLMASAYALFGVRWHSHRFRVVATATAAGIITLLICAIHLAPLLEAIPQTREFQHRETGVAGGKTLSIAWHVMRANFLPYLESAPHPVHHEWAGTSYAGALVFAPALAALIMRRKKREVWFFAALLVFGWLAGAETPGVYHLLAHLPLFSIAVNARLIEFAAFALCVLAAIGLDTSCRVAKLQSCKARLWNFGTFQLCNSLSVAAAIVITLLTISSVNVETLNRLAAARELLPLLLFFAVAWRAPRMATVAAIGLLLLQRTTEMRDFIPTVDRRAADPPVARLRELARTGEPFRIVGKGALLTPNLATLFDLEDVRGYQAMTLARYAATFPRWSAPQSVWSNRVDDLTSPFLSIMNVRYAVVPRSGVTPPGWRDAGAMPGARLIENLNAKPRAFTDVPGTIATRARGGRLDIHASMREPGWVVVSEPAWRGWRVTRNGAPIRTEIAYDTFLKFYLPQGESDVVMRYRPKGFVYGAIVSAIALWSAAAMPPLLSAIRKRRPRRRTPN